MKENLLLHSFLRREEVLAMLAISQATLYRGIKNGTYPAPYPVSEGRVAWATSEIIDIINKIKAQNKKPA